MLFFSLICIGELTGCIKYHPMPISRQSINKKLMPPDINKTGHPVNLPFGKKYLFPKGKYVLTPEKAATLAIIANPKLRVIRDKEKIASAELIKAGTLPNPSLSYSIGIPDNKNSKNGLGFGINWDISSLFMRTGQIKAARNNIISTKFNILWQEWQVAENARMYAYNLIFAEKRLALAKMERSIFKKILKNTIKGADLGIKTISDVLIARAELSESELGIINKKAIIEKQRLKLNSSIGFPPSTIIPMQKSIVPILKQYPSAKILFHEALDKRLDLAALRFGYKAQEEKLRSAINSAFPKINIGIIRERDTDGLKTTGFGLNIEFPFFNRNQGQIAMETASRKQLFDKYILRVFKARSNIFSIISAIKIIKHRIKSMDKNILLLKQTAENYRKAADTGRIDILSYYKILEDLFKKQSDRIDLEQKIIDFGIGLEIASGHYGFVGEKEMKKRIKK